MSEFTGNGLSGGPPTRPDDWTPPEVPDWVSDRLAAEAAIANCLALTKYAADQLAGAFLGSAHESADRIARASDALMSLYIALTALAGREAR